MKSDLKFHYRMDKPKTTPKDFFLYIAAVITLYVSAGSLLSLLFDIINSAFPDALSNMYYYGYSGGERFAIASLIVVFPVYLLISWILRKDVVLHPEKKELWVRKWLTYLNLFVTGSVVVGDLIALLNTFLGGEITTRFILKVLAVLIVSGAVFAYYFYDLRRSAEEKKGVSLGLVFASCLFVLVSIVSGFVVMGSPATARSERFDATRVMDLQSIQSQVVYNYYQQKGALPASLDDLNDSLGYFSIPVDPETKQSYVYKQTTDLSFQLCATFALDTTEKDALMREKSTMAYPAYPGGVSENWQHPKGMHCFDRKIDSELYPVRKGL